MKQGARSKNNHIMNRFNKLNEYIVKQLQYDALSKSNECYFYCLRVLN